MEHAFWGLKLFFTEKILYEQASPFEKKSDKRERLSQPFKIGY